MIGAPDLRSIAPPGGFGVIYADPPWKFATYGAGPNRKGADHHYPVLTFAELAGLPVARIAAPDCWLAMWTTWPCLPQALDLIKAWGFAYSTGGAWAKQSTTGRAWQFGTGYVFRSASEPLLMASRGNPPWQSKSERNLWVAPIREHSRKPDDVYEMLERATVGDRLEMFARSTRPGWVAWGNESQRFEPKPRKVMSAPRPPISAAVRRLAEAGDSIAIKALKRSESSTE